MFENPALEYDWDFHFRSVMSAEFLLLNGAKINAADFKGNTSLHLAASHGSTGQVKYAKHLRTVDYLQYYCKMER